ncbi:flagellar motor switch protein FliN [Chitinivibrio alkaliphilus]|uniref:Flagellar motor switch protein FliN n=1 Tax=Chitinivibrio alkaliphilus ACht1 TaxID=1313304 RepID=U7D7B9_9BACT|nr:flagellar motor switch protein FliN [Chitinivibrio alkaliphilus]ERP38840.1 flagellar motor switch protein FliN [Chitinivibrio alkaliphilus ACht1]
MSENSINMLLDVPVKLSVQLGQTRMSVRKLLKLKKGKLVLLNRLSGESVDVLVNNKLLAKGEITVDSDKINVRISNLYSSKERFQHL